MDANTLKTPAKKPGYPLAFAAFLGIAGIIGYGLLGMGLEPHIPLSAAAVFAALVGKYLLGVEWADMESSIFSAITSALSALLILIVIGMLIGSWVMAGVVPGMIFYGFNLLSPEIFLFATLLICSIVSLATGSSWGVGGTVGVALIGIASGLGIPAPLTAGIIISGAYFGDKMSPLSDTTNLAPGVSGSNLFDHIQAMLWTTVPSYIIVAALTLFLGFHYTGGSTSADLSRIQAIQQIMSKEFSIDPFFVAAPALVVLILAMLRFPAIPSMMAGVAAASAVSLLQGHTLHDVLYALHYGYKSTIAAQISELPLDKIPELLARSGISDIAPETAHGAGKLLVDLLNRGGVESMMWSLSLIIIALILGGIMESCRYLEVLLVPMLAKLRSAGGLVALTMGSCVASNVFLGDQYLGIVVPGRIFKTTYDRGGLSPRMLSRTLEDAGTMTAVMVPWTGCGAFQANALGVSTLAYAPYCFLNYLNPIVALLMTYMGIGIYWGKNKADRLARRTLLLPLSQEEGTGSTGVSSASL